MSSNESLTSPASLPGCRSHTHPTPPTPQPPRLVPGLAYALDWANAPGYGDGRQADPSPAPPTVGSTQDRATEPMLRRAKRALN